MPSPYYWRKVNIIIFLSVPIVFFVHMVLVQTVRQRGIWKYFWFCHCVLLRPNVLSRIDIPSSVHFLFRCCCISNSPASCSPSLSVILERLLDGYRGGLYYCTYWYVWPISFQDAYQSPLVTSEEVGIFRVVLRHLSKRYPFTKGDPEKVEVRIK